MSGGLPVADAPPLGRTPARFPAGGGRLFLAGIVLTATGFGFLAVVESIVILPTPGLRGPYELAATLSGLAVSGAAVGIALATTGWGTPEVGRSDSGRTDRSVPIGRRGLPLPVALVATGGGLLALSEALGALPEFLVVGDPFVLWSQTTAVGETSSLALAGAVALIGVGWYLLQTERAGSLRSSPAAEPVPPDGLAPDGRATFLSRP